MAAAATVQTTMDSPGETVFSPGVQENRLLKISASTTATKMSRFFFAGGTTMAMNMP